jgi:hypothetical protein
VTPRCGWTGAVRGRDAFVATVPDVGLTSLTEAEWHVGTGR